MKSFIQWLKEVRLGEDGMRTCLGPYPDSYGAGQYPPEYFMPISASAALSLKNWHHLDDKKPKKGKKKHKKSED